MTLGIGAEEYKRRTDMVLAKMAQEGLDAFVFWNNTSVLYLSGFSFIPTERPICMILVKTGEKTAFVPRLEVEHARKSKEISDIVSYPEYPGTEHPLSILGKTLEKMGLGSATIGCDAIGYGSTKGYSGPILSEVLPKAKFVVLRTLVEEIRVIKSPQELALIRESARWGNLGHALLQEYSLPGRNENDVAMRASLEATNIMIKTMGDSYDPHAMGGATVAAGFRGQIGPNAALPHAISVNAVMREGDVLVTYSCPWVGGYTSELERTMFVGKPDAEKRKFFEFMLEIQETAFENIRPGRKCSDVDKAVLAVYEKRGLMEYWRHHTGHALGMLNHEAPFFDTGDDTVLTAGMVFSVEPGLYVPGVGGFRHSDTVLVTETGMEILTYYPRELDRLICG